MKERNVLYWWITFTLICLGFVAFFVSGLHVKINDADVTKISFLIGALFLYYSVRIGLCNYKLSRGKITTETLDKGERQTKQAWFMSDIFLTLGMIGTVIGFIYMLSISFGNLSVENTTGLKLALQTMGTGMSTALYTTAAGLVCSLLMKIQLYPLTQFIRRLRRRKNEGRRVVS